MINTNDHLRIKLSPWRNIFNNAHKFYNCTDCYQSTTLRELFKWNYGETPAFYVRKA